MVFHTGLGTLMWHILIHFECVLAGNKILLPANDTDSKMRKG